LNGIYRQWPADWAELLISKDRFAIDLMQLKLIINCRMLHQSDIGLGAYTARLIRGLARHAHQAEVVCFAPAGCDFSFPAGIHVVCLPRFRFPKLLADVAFDWAVDWNARRKYPYHTLLHPVPTAFASRPEQTCVVHHDCIPVHFPIYLGKKIVRRLIARRCDAIARRCRLVLTDSDFSRQDIIRHLGISPDRICTVHNWLPPEYNSNNAKKYADKVRRKYGLPKRFWLYVGGYDIRKNVEFLLLSYAMAKQKTPCPPLVLAGRIPASGTYAYCEVHKTMTDLHLQAGYEVILPGFIASEDMPSLYGAAELLIYPSLYEGFGLPPMEAMGCGCPAVSANNTSLPEVIKDSSYRFNAQLPDELINLLIRAASKALPMNPSFTKSDFNEKTLISLMISHLSV
jgi:glycosyltransferase involved in cell wall biosynthesis